MTDAQHILFLQNKIAELESERDAILLLNVNKWFDEIPNVNNATKAAMAREIALKAIDERDETILSLKEKLYASYHNAALLAMEQKAGYQTWSSEVQTTFLNNFKNKLEQKEIANAAKM